MRKRVVAIVGATATGKSALALAVASRIGGAVVNADSRQIYRRMDVGTAKPTAAERQAVPHHLYDIADPAETYSLALFQAHARRAFAQIWERGATPVLVGGTGQYAWGLLEHWTVPEAGPDEALRSELGRLAAEEGPQVLHARLAAIDPESADRIDARNVRRVVRAIEVQHLTGIPFSQWQQKQDPGFEAMVIGIDLPRAELDARIAARVEQMFADGFVAEVRALLAEGVPADAPAMSSIGYRQVVALLRGELGLAAAKEEIARATRRLARRQDQWFRRTDPRISWVQTPDEGLARAVGAIAGS